MADINTIISKEAITGIKTADTNITSLDDNIKNFVSTLVKANTELKTQGITFKDLATAQKQQKQSSQELTDEQKKLNAIEKQNVVTTKQVLTEKIKLADKTKRLKDEIIKENAALKEEANSINALNRRNKELNKLRDQVNTSTKKGQALIKKYNRELDKNNAVIKKNKDALSQQKIGIGGYSAGIQNAAGQMGLFGGAATKMTAALGFVSVSLKTLRGAIMSTGIGALIIGFIALVQYFKSTEEGAAKLQKIIAPFKILFGNITDALADLGEKLVWVFDNPKQAVSDLWTVIETNLVNRVKAIPLFFTGIFDTVAATFSYLGNKIKLVLADIPIIGKGIDTDEAEKNVEDALANMADGADKTKDAFIQMGTGLTPDQIIKMKDATSKFFKDIADQTRDETAQQTLLIDAQLALDKKRRQFLVDEAKIMTEISTLRLLANDETKDLHDRQNAINEALRLTGVLADQRMANEQEQLRIMKLEASFSKSDADTLNAIAEKEREIVLLKKTQADSSRMMVMKQATINNKLEAQLKIENDIADAKAAQFDMGDEGEIDDIEPFIEGLGKKNAAILKAGQDAIKNTNAIETIRLADIQAAYDAEIISKEEFEALKTQIEAEAEDKRQQKREEVAAIAIDALNMGVEIYQGVLARKAQALDQQREIELQNAGDDKNKQAEINKKFDIKEAALKTKQAKADKTAALITAAINTAVAISSVSPVVPLMVLAAAFGALQIAAIAAQPIPKFFKGTDSAPDGLISVGEKGRELIETRSGKLLMANEQTVTSGLKGAKIYTNEQTERIMNHSGYDSQDLRGVIDSNNRIERAIKNIPRVKIDRDNRKITERKGDYYRTYLNSKVNGI